MRHKFVLAATVSVVACLLIACTAPVPPRGVQVIEPFDASRFLGRWYEIARLDQPFENGLTQVTATYSQNSDGSINVINRGYNVARGKWQQIEGTAKFTGSPQRAALKVSFFGPFYGGYNVIALDDNYQHALVCGPNRDYLWILSRTPTLDSRTRTALLSEARRQGFDTRKLLWVEQRH